MSRHDRQRAKDSQKGAPLKIIVTFVSAPDAQERMCRLSNLLLSPWLDNKDSQADSTSDEHQSDELQN